MGSFLSSVLNLIAVKYVLSATGYLFLFMTASGLCVIAIVVACSIREELDVENLQKRDAVTFEPHSIVN